MFVKKKRLGGELRTENNNKITFIANEMGENKTKNTFGCQ